MKINLQYHIFECISVVKIKLREMQIISTDDSKATPVATETVWTGVYIHLV